MNVEETLKPITFAVLFYIYIHYTQLNKSVIILIYMDINIYIYL